MCSGSGKVQSDAQQEQDLQLATSKTLAQNYNTTFAQQQGVLTNSGRLQTTHCKSFGSHAARNGDCDYFD